MYGIDAFSYLEIGHFSYWVCDYKVLLSHVFCFLIVYHLKWIMNCVYEYICWYEKNHL